ncbi:MAG TPA: RNA methyltransferase [Firmicutes bacterium]|nr:RNA methyltransferase [Bacillota bacterium]
MAENFRTKDREDRLRSVLDNRYADLQLILEEIHNTHNISAILRTADGLGVQNINLIYTAEESFRINPLITKGVHKWMNINQFETVKQAVLPLKEAGYKIYSTGFSKDSVPFLEVDFTLPCAIILGNEHEGVSDFAKSISDKTIYLPMFGFSQSFNVSVANAIILSEARRQRIIKGNSGNIPEEMKEEIFQKWIKL